MKILYLIFRFVGIVFKLDLYFIYHRSSGNYKVQLDEHTKIIQILFCDDHSAALLADLKRIDITPPLLRSDPPLYCLLTNEKLVAVSRLAFRQSLVFGNPKMKVCTSLKSGFVKGVLVPSVERGKGYGGKLINEIESYHQLSNMFCHINFINQASKQMFTKNGFKKIGFFIALNNKMIYQSKPIRTVWSDFFQISSIE